MIERERGAVRYLQFHSYQQFPELVHGIFTRQGGYSRPPFSSLNVSLSSEEERYEDVVRNRYLTLQSLDIAHYPCATMWIIHSARVLTLDGQEWPAWRADWPQSICDLSELGYPEGTRLQWTFEPHAKADAIITRKRGVALPMSAADCAALFFYDPTVQAIGVAHAGWRGTARGIAVATIVAMQEQFGCKPANIHVGIGPSIGPCCYEVSEEVRQLFLGYQFFDNLPTEERFRSLVAESAAFSVKERSGEARLHFNLWETNRRQMILAGVLSEHIELPEICTSCATDQFFSYRAEQGRTGRFPAILALRA